MATQVQLRRGTTTEHASFTGAIGEVTVDITKDTLVVHDGSTAGGYPLAKSSELSTYQPLDADLTAIAGLTGTSGLLKKTAADTWSLDTSTYLTGNQSISFTGDVTGSGSTSVTLTLASNAVTYGKIQNVSATDRLLGRSSAGAGVIEEITCTSFARTLLDDGSAAAARSTLGIQEVLVIAVSNEDANLTTGTAKVTFRMPYAATLNAVKASVTTAPTGSNLIVDINESGVSVLSTKLSIDATEKTSATAATSAVISDSSLADDAEMTIDIDQIGSTLAGTGLKVYFYLTRS